jgi:hypothetical protein
MFKAMVRAVLLCAFLLPLSAAAQNQTEWYVATNGSDATGDGSASNPFQTIQYAIDAAGDGDVVIVLEGRHTGPGNRDLDFKGKAITVRSRDPDDDACMRETIIDAEGQGVIVRFVNDEGPESKLTGFSLVAGNTAVDVQGIPGFFELSDNARPTTSRLRVLGGGPAAAREQPILIAEGPPYGGRAWDGNNPFHQPAATTDYYGSGDVDGDGRLTSTDASLAQEMAAGSRALSIRADADGDGTVNGADVSLISSALAGSALPGWWNSLTQSSERNAWVTKIMGIDQTDQHPYDPGFFVCGNFAMQTFIHGAFYRGDLYYVDYNGGPTAFNVPMYVVSVSSLSYGHAINAILIHDDPLNFDHWRFLEPQTDFDVHPGSWNMPYGTNVRIGVPERLFPGGYNPSTKVIFYVDETGWTLVEYSPDLTLVRPVPVTVPPNNLPDLWNPRIAPADPGMILFERTRDDMSHITDIHLADLPFVDPPVGTPLIMDSQFSRLLDISQGPDGTVHLIWKGKPEYDPGLFYAQLDPISGTVQNMTRVSSRAMRVRTGRIVILPDGQIHVFWLQTDSSQRGIHWSTWTGSNWQSAQNLTPEMDYISEYPSWDNRDLLRYFFDVTLTRDGDILFVWADPISSEYDAILSQMLYNGNWGSASVIETAYIRGLELITDSTGTVHLVYWLSEWQSSIREGRGNLVHRTYEGSSWSDPVTVDSSGNACCPRMAAGPQGEVYLVWERSEGEQVVPIWNTYTDSAWGTAQSLAVRPEADAWYPTIDVLPDGRVVVTWSSRSPDRVTIEMATVAYTQPVYAYLPFIMK